MTAALDRPGLGSALTAWTPQPVAIAVVAALGWGYLRGLQRVDGNWPRRRVITFAFGLVALLWASCGFAQVYAGSLYWVWTAQALTLWLAVPIVLLAGHPVQLAASVSGPGGRVARVLRSRPVRVLGNPLVGPALVPVLSAVLFFGPLPGWAVASAPVGWTLQVVLLAVGAIMVLPLVGLDDEASSLAVGLSLAIGSFELVMDALPGVILRLHTGLATSFFAHRAGHPWTPNALADQRVAGAIVWCVAEIIDLPFLVLVYRRWLRADARDAAQVDAVLEAERAARGALPPRGRQPSRTAGQPGDVDAAAEADRDTPWWLSDPAMRQRLRRRD